MAVQPDFDLWADIVASWPPPQFEAPAFPMGLVFGLPFGIAIAWLWIAAERRTSR